MVKRSKGIRSKSRSLLRKKPREMNSTPIIPKANIMARLIVMACISFQGYGRSEAEVSVSSLPVVGVVRFLLAIGPRSLP